ncbi:MAG TPA: hypothetical protein VMX14_08675 [Anaerolineae bacterium]|nr:hypothetical protein [Anaerolineae bacterium]
MVRRIGTEAVAVLAWLVSAVIGLAAAMQAYEATRVLAAVMIPINPNDTVASGYLILLVPRVALILLAIGWLAGIILLLASYSKVVGEGRRLAISFVKTTAIELIVLGLGSAVICWVPSLALRGIS